MINSLTKANRWLFTPRSETRATESGHQTFLLRTNGQAVTISRFSPLGVGEAC